jgi:copper transport protein
MAARIAGRPFAASDASPVVRRAAVAVAIAAVFVVAVATPAFAHAELERSQPGANAELPAGDPPARIRLEFTEAVRVNEGAIRLLDGAGEPVPGIGSAERIGDGSIVELTLPRLADGSYVVDWRVVSADSHPISGAFTFDIGEPTSDRGAIAAALERSENSGAVGVAFWLVRLLAFTSVLVLAGSIVFVTAIAGAAPAERPVRTLWWSAWAVALVTALIGIGLQAAYTREEGFGAMFDGDALGDVLATGFGRSWLLRALVLVAGLAVFSAVERARGTRPRLGYAAGALVLVATFTFAGHARAGQWVTVATVLDVVHLAAAALWLGGIMVVALRVTRASEAVDASRTAAHFSWLAGPTMLVIVLTGALQTLRQSDGISSLVDSSYGRLLLAKVGVVGGIVAIAAGSRRIVRLVQRRALLPAGFAAPAPEGDGDRDEGNDRLRLAWMVGAEIAAAVVVLGLTAALVNAVPARNEGASAAASAGPYAETLEARGYAFVIGIEPAKPGVNVMHLTVLDAGGSPVDTREASASLASVSGDISAITIPLQRLSPGHYYAAGFRVPVGGEWRLAVRAAVTDIQAVVVEDTVRVG